MVTITHRAIDGGGFEGWVRMAKPGAVCLYHTGSLANDRVEGSLAALRIHNLADTVAHYTRKELVNVIQRRLRPEVYEYLAVRTSKPYEKKPSAQPVPALAA